MDEEMKCPVCNKVNILSTYSGPYGLEESHYNCSRCGYLDEFAYGYTRNIVKGVCLCSSWRDNYTQEKLASKLNTTHSVISVYESGKSTVSTLFLIEIAKKQKNL